MSLEKPWVSKMQITGGFLKSRKISSPKGSNVRPTLSQVRESVFSVLFSMMEFENKTFLDVFAGSGIMGFEAVSRGFSKANFIEKDKKTFFLLKENAKILGLTPQQTTFHIGDSLKVLKKFDEGFDVIYVDPPYMAGLYDDIINIIRENGILNENGVLILEHPTNLEINFENSRILKQKTYAGKTLSFLEFLN